MCGCVRGERERGCVYKSPDIGKCACGAACVGVWVCGCVGVWVCGGGGEREGERKCVLEESYSSLTGALLAALECY